MAVRTAFLRGLRIIDKTKEYQEKAKQTKDYTARLPEMQRYVGQSKEKRELLLKVLHEENDRLLKKGVVIFVRLLDTADIIIKDLEADGIECALINSKVSTKGRKNVAEWFKENPEKKVIVITEAGACSVSLNATDELILYESPKGPGKFSQCIGRICRNFGNFTEFNIHFIIVEETLDEYQQILLSAKKELELEILHADTIQVKEVTSFDQQVLKKIRQRMLWKKRKK